VQIVHYVKQNVVEVKAKTPSPLTSVAPVHMVRCAKYMDIYR